MSTTYQCVRYLSLLAVVWACTGESARAPGSSVQNSRDDSSTILGLALARRDSSDPHETDGYVRMSTSAHRGFESPLLYGGSRSNE